MTRALTTEATKPEISFLYNLNILFGNQRTRREDKES